MVCSSPLHSQAAEGAMLHLCKQERKRSTPVWRRISWTHAILGRAISWGRVPVSGMKLPNPCSVVQPLCIPSVVNSERAALLLLSSDELMSCCAAGANGCLVLRCSWALTITHYRLCKPCSKKKMFGLHAHTIETNGEASLHLDSDYGLIWSKLL